jgi:hypothetical protein
MTELHPDRVVAAAGEFLSTDAPQQSFNDPDAAHLSG